MCVCVCERRCRALKWGPLSISPSTHTYMHSCTVSIILQEPATWLSSLVCMCAWDVGVLKCRTPTSSHLHARTQMSSRIVCVCVWEEVHGIKVGTVDLLPHTHTRTTGTSNMPLIAGVCVWDDVVVLKCRTTTTTSSHAHTYTDVF